MIIPNEEDGLCLLVGLSNQSEHFNHVLCVAFADAGNDTVTLHSIEAQAVAPLFIGIDLL